MNPDRARSERRQRTELVPVRLLPAEREQLETMAATRGIGVSTLLREAGLTPGSHLEVRTDNDEQHRELARGALRNAERALGSDATPNEYLGTDVVEEAGLAWLTTGLLPSALPQREQDEICAAIAGRVATVLVMVGWRPPRRLVPDNAP